MKKIFIALFLILFIPGISFSTNWYAQSSSVNINTASLWNDNPAGGGNTLTWGNQAEGDVFYANAKTALAVNVDPGANGKVTLTTAAGAGTAGGGFTYTTATNITLNVDLTGGTTTVLTVIGSTGGLTIVGNILGGGASAYALNDAHTVITVNVTGNITGGSSASGYGISYGGASGVLAINGNVTGATGPGLFLINTGTATVTGNCIGSSTVNTPGCQANSTGTITIIGNIVNTTRAAGGDGSIIFNPGALDYIQYPAPAAGTIYLPKDPGIANVKAGVQYGFDGVNPLTGTYSPASGGGAWAF